MEVLYKRCCGIDIHKNMMVACVFTSVRKKEIRQYSTMTDDILKLVSWLKELAVFIVICETILSFSPTGVYKRYIKPFVGLILLLRISAFLIGTVEVD